MDEHTSHELAYKKGYEDGKPKWIPVTERLPELFGQHVLVTDGRYVKRGYILNFSIKGVSPWCTEAPVMPHSVTHWMPLPEPPKGE